MSNIGSNVGNSIEIDIGSTSSIAIWLILNGIFNVLAFIKSVFVNFGHVAKFVLQERQFWVIMFRTLMQLENRSFTKISHLLK